MPRHQYVTGVLFDDDEIDPAEHNPNGFRRRIPCPMPKKTITSNGNLTNQEHQKQLLKKKQEIEKSTVESAMRSLKLLHETQEIGIHTARELSGQGEQLEKTNTRLDEIDSHLKQSRKDINGIQSVFYGFKNIISGKSRSPSPSHHNKKRKGHKKTPKIEKSKFYETKDHSFLGAMKSAEFETASTSLPNLSLEYPAEPPSSQQVDDILEAHLEGITHHIEQLAQLGTEFGKEIDHQNELIDILQDKVEGADINIGKQNKDMNKILGK